MIYLVEQLNSQGNPVLGTEGRHIFRQYKSLQALERYQIKRLVKSYGKLWVSVYMSDNIYGKPTRVYQYENSETQLRGFWRCVAWQA